LVAHGDVVEAEHSTLDALTAYLHGEDLEPLANDPCVLTVSSDAEVSPSGAWWNGAAVERAVRLFQARFGELRRSSSKAPPAVGEVRALLGLEPDDETGRNVGVAIIDSGLELSEDFDRRRVDFWDFTRGGRRWLPYDDYGHGTHIAGLIASAAVSHPDYGGVAPNVNLKIFKVLDRDGRGRTSQVLSAMEFIIAHHERLGIDIINLSLGHPVFESAATDPLVQVVELAVRHGITVVVAAGNNGQNPETGEVGYAGINSPGNAPSAITAGAADTGHTVPRDDDTVAPFSSRGPTWYDGFLKPDVVAPGVALVSNISRRGTLATEYPGLLIDPHYASLSGTSMASAVTTGLVAVIKSANPPLTPNAIKGVLQFTATPLVGPTGAQYDLLTQGAGEINGDGALQLARAIDTTVPVGESWANLAALHPYVSTVFGHTAGCWFENIVWGSYVVMGDVLGYHTAAWYNIVWGSAFLRGDDNIVWGSSFSWDGDNIVWGSSILWHDNIVWGSWAFDNIVWGSSWFDNIVWGSSLLGYRSGDNIVWGSWAFDNIVWGSNWFDNIVWGSLFYDADNIVWGSYRFDNIVWGSSASPEKAGQAEGGLQG
jgi:serine protease AprX